jgi:hypothetical protein
MINLNVGRWFSFPLDQCLFCFGFLLSDNSCLFLWLYILFCFALSIANVSNYLVCLWFYSISITFCFFLLEFSPLYLAIFFEVYLFSFPSNLLVPIVVQSTCVYVV